MYAEFTTSQRQQVWQNCHMNAFDALGVAKKLRYDNLKTVVISRQKLLNGEEKINYNFDFLNFSRYYKFQIEICPRYYPRAKGKVEAGIKYLRNNFMSGEVFKKSFGTLDELNLKLKMWLESLANERIHGTTKLKPHNEWILEKEHLFTTIDYPRYRHTCIQSRWASQFCMVTYQKSSYEVPPEYARKKIDIEEKIENGRNKLIFNFKGKEIIQHIQSLIPGGWIRICEEKRKSRSKKLKKLDKEKIDKIYSINIRVRKIDYYDNIK